MKITLLSHSKELTKKSNTGKLVLEILGEHAEQISWDRMNPPSQLLEEIAAGGVALVYPGSIDENDGDLSGISQFVLIDSTWHEARKIHQRSPYLLGLRRVALKPSGKSRYNLRKNQKPDCLCTAECVIEILKMSGDMEAAERLEQRFLSFIRPESAMRGTVMGS